MGEAARYPTLAPVLFVTLHLHMLPESRAAYADVDDDIETAPFSNRLLTTVLKSAAYTYISTERHRSR